MECKEWFCCVLCAVREVAIRAVDDLAVGA